MMNNNLRSGIIATGIIGVTILLAAYFTITGFAVQSSNSIEKTIQIEVWANSYVELEAQQDSIIAKVYLDNGTLLENSNIELLLSNYSLSNSQNKSLFNLSEESPGKYIIKVSSQGSHSQYINPTFIEKEIEITENNGVKEVKIVGQENGEEIINRTILETNVTNINVTAINSTNFTIPKGINCKEFTEQVLWTSNYINDIEGSTNYQTWYPEYNCSIINKTDCYFGNVEIKTRFLYFGENNQKGEGYVQISNLSDCANPQNAIYSKYLAYESLTGEARKFGQYCGNNKNSDSKCGVEFNQNILQRCYGVKSHASQYLIVDTFEIKYNLCYNE